MKAIIPGSFTDDMRQLSPYQRTGVLLGFCRQLGGCHEDATQEIDAYSGHCVERDVYRRPAQRKALPGETNPSFDNVVRAYEDG